MRLGSHGIHFKEMFSVFHRYIVFFKTFQNPRTVPGTRVPRILAAPKSSHRTQIPGTPGIGTKMVGTVPGLWALAQSLWDSSPWDKYPLNWLSRPMPIPDKGDRRFLKFWWFLLPALGIFIHEMRFFCEISLDSRALRGNPNKKPSLTCYF